MFSSLRVRILLAALAAITLGLIINGVVNYATVKHHNDEQIARNLKAVVSGNAKALNEWFNARLDMLESMEAAATSNAPGPALRQFLTSGGFISTYIGYPGAGEITYDNDFQPPSGYDARERPWYKAAVSAQEAIITAPYIDAQTHELVVTFARPFYLNGELTAVVGADIPISNIVETVTGISPTLSSFGFLTTHDGTLVAHPDADLILTPVSAINEQLTAGSINQLMSATTPLPLALQGDNKLLLGHVIGGENGWRLIVALDEYEATAGLRAIATSSLIILVVVAVITALAFGLLLSLLLRRLLGVRNAMDNIASGEGDLTQRLPEEGNDEVTQIAHSFNRFVARMDEVMLTIRDSSQSVQTAANEISMGGQDLSRRTDNAASSLQQSSASIEEITSTIEHTAEAAQQANQLSMNASEVANKGGQVVDQVVITMGDISAASHKISDIVSLMDGIAFQTNLLALNASVEAARAGEHGRGFAVVADEVRKLAQRSSDASSDIKTLIDTSHQTVTNGTELVQSAGATMRDIVESITRVTDVLGEIGAATREQSDGIHQVNIAVAELDRMTQQNAAMVEESTTAAEHLKEQSLRLSDVVGGFTLSNGSASQHGRLIPPSPTLASRHS
ncbi:Methyl-accepting chemotaxis protein I (serine chemoreceptor protein) [Halomonas citrativorans]|uniref:Methyl-accepting chemotaxis protein I (Serine chemoreceptor protein) n=1 Tax=Halomonas citrativorans TaxID=2742612 RepID=A0A1R4I3S0_9GAMM|nr:methyl-accepting chemotaxis protein [Halomonas citrativorans]SJN14450.1 Methyl-accepting chemotaxis protein I (serine chemoreceptor protein) [Halomonas citrativorans]